MANNGIKGIVIEIGGDTKGLNNALKDVNKQSKDLQDELKAVERGLKFDPGNVELVRQKQELLTASIQSTSEKLDVLKTAQSQVEAQFQRGDIGVEQYRAFQRELQSTEGEMTRLQGQLNSLSTDQDRLAQTTRQLGTFFEATNTDVEQFASTLGTRLTQSIRDGSASADQMERALRLMGQQALGAGTDIDQMREALRNADNGANLDEIRADLTRISGAADEAEESVKGFGNELSTVVGGLAAGGGIAGVVSSALDASSLKTMIDISFNVPEESKQSIFDAVKSIEVYGVEGEEALEGIRRQWALNKDASDESNASLVQGAAVVAKAYAGIDFIELIQETNELAAELEISNEEALALTNSLLKTGFPPEQLDTMAEYGKQMKAIGFSTTEIQSIFEKGVETKSWNIDNLNDGVKEARLQMATFGLEIPKALKPLLTDTGLSLTQFQNWGKAVAGGGKEGAKAMAEVSEWLQTIEDDALRNEMAIKVFGTKAEDQGDNMSAVFQGLAEAQDKTIQNQNELNGALERINQDPLVMIKNAFKETMANLQPLLLMIASFIATIAEWISNNTGLAATLAVISVALGVLLGAFAVLMPAIGALVGLWPALVLAIGGISAPILIAVGAVVGLGAAFIALWQNSETFRDNLTSVFEAIKSVVVTVFETVASFIGEKISAIKQFWDTEGSQILKAAENIFNGIMAVVKFVMPAIQFLIDIVWTAIKQVITGALDVIMGAVKVFSGLFTGDFSKMWEGIKQIFSGAIELIIGWFTLTFVGGLRSLITNFAKTGVKLFKGMWDDTLSAFKTAGTNIQTSLSGMLTNIRTAFVNMVTAVKTQMVAVGNNIKSGWNTAVNYLKQINLVQIGKDIIAGLVKGIGAAASTIKDKVEELASNIPDWAKKILGIKSPSRVMAEVGKWTGLGLAGGIDGTKSTVQKSVEDLGKLIIGIAQKNLAEEKKITASSKAEITKLEKRNAEDIQKIITAASTKKRKLTADDLLKIERLKEDSAKKIADIETKSAKQSMDIISKNQKEVLDGVKLFISNRQTLGQMDSVQEATIWARTTSLFVEGTKERVEAQQAYAKAVEDVNGKITSINTKYMSDMQKIDDNFVKQSEEKTKKYEDTLSAREKALFSFTDMFSVFDATIKESGTDLLNNLDGQINGFKEWQKEIENISAKAIDDGLIAELTAMGPKALGELKALNSLSETELQKYSNLYKEKASLARTQAEKELLPLKTSTQNEIIALRDVANKELSKLETDWIKEIKAITGGTANELKSLESIGADAVRGLISGMDSMHKDLQTTAKALGDTVSKATANALKVKSPSRVMMEIGEWTVAGMIKGIESMQGKAQTTAEKMASWFVPETASLEELKKQADAYALYVNSNNAEKINTDAETKRNELAEKHVDLLHEKNAEYTELLEHLRTMYATEQEALDRTNLIIGSKYGFDERYVSYSQDLMEINIAEQRQLTAHADYLNSGLELDKKYRAEKFDLEKKFIEKSKSLNELSLVDEMKLYESFTADYAAGTEERIYYEQKLATVRKDIYDQLVKANSDYTSKIQSANQKLIDGELELNKAYEDAVKTRADSLYNFIGIFDKVEKKSGITGARLMRNLRGQTDTMKKWQKNLDNLSSKGIDEGLLSELRNMGPSMATEIAALNTLSKSELDEYSSLWREKTSLARTQAEVESIGLKNETIAQIEELRAETARQLSQYASEWESAVSEINKTTTNEFDAMAASTPEIGAKIIQGLQSGLSSMTGALYEQVQAIANTMRSTIQSALDFASSSSANLSSSISDASASLSNSASMASGSSGSYSTSTTDNSRVFAPNVTINTTDSGTKAMDSTLRRLAFQF